MPPKQSKQIKHQNVKKKVVIRKEEIEVNKEQASFLSELLESLDVGTVLVVTDQYFESKKKQQVMVEAYVTEERHNIKDYTVEMLLSEATQYLEMEPMDLLQSSMKIWAAAVIALKHFVLAFDINPVSLDSMSIFVKFAVELAIASKIGHAEEAGVAYEPDIAQLSVAGIAGEGDEPVRDIADDVHVILTGWNQASELHRYMYQLHLDHNKFVEAKDCVVNFIEKLGKIDCKNAGSRMESFLEIKKTNKKLKVINVQKTRIVVGRKEFFYNKLCS